MNVLISCAGRRSYLVEWFRRAVAPDGRVLAANSFAESTAMVVADAAYVVPTLSDPDYVEVLLDLCVRQHVGLVVPVFDLELPMLAAARSRFAAAGVEVAVSSPDVVAACQDKLGLVDVAGRAGLRAARTTDEPEVAKGWMESGTAQVFVKPRWGTGSILTWSTDEASEVVVLAHKVQRELASTYLPAGVVVQEGVAGDEHGLTVVNDLAGRWRAVLANRKLSMRAGETDRAETVRDRRLDAAGRALGEALGHVGALDVDLFIDDDDQITLIDLNPRVGGNYPFSHLAGADLPAAYVRWAGGQAVDDAMLAVEPGVVGLKAITPLRMP